MAKENMMKVRNKKWKALFYILHMTHNMSAKELHQLCVKKRKKINISTIRKWKSGKTVSPKFETMQIVLESLGKTFTIVDQDDNQDRIRL